MKFMHISSLFVFDVLLSLSRIYLFNVLFCQFWRTKVLRHIILLLQIALRPQKTPLNLTN